MDGTVLRTVDLLAGQRVFVRLPYDAGSGHAYVVDTEPGRVLIDWEDAPSRFYRDRSPHWILARQVVRIAS